MPPHDTNTIALRLREILFDKPQLTCDELLAALQQQGERADLGQVRTLLMRQSETFVGGYSRHARWDLTSGARNDVSRIRTTTTRQPPAPRIAPPCPTAFSKPQVTCPAELKRSLRGAPPLVESIQEVLLQEPNVPAKHIAMQLSRRGIAVDRGAVNSALYRYRGYVFEKDNGKCPLWRALDKQANTGALTAPGAPRPLPRPTPIAQRAPGLPPLPQSIPLYAWQQQALAAWEAEGRRGIVEAVTGTGKTRVGIIAIRDSLAAGGVAHVLVPTIDLQDQWCRELTALFPGIPIGRRGNDRTDTFPRFRLIVSVVNSARDYDVGSLPPHSLIVGDECHRYGADGNAKALRDEFPRRLGLTATFAREDGGCEAFLAPYFGDTCFQMGYAQAIEDEVTAHFKVALVGVDFGSDAERAEYDAAAEQGGKARHWLVSQNWAPPEPFGDFVKHVASLASNDPVRTGRGDEYTAVRKAREYMKSFSTRRKLLASTTSKRDALAGLIDAIRVASRTIVFTESIETATHAAAILRQHRVRASAVHSKMRIPERKAILSQFANGEVEAITAPKVLDEGIDVPAADLAIIFATSKTRRQMVQRMGRVLRRKTDGRLARFVVLYVEGTTEDPATGAHESFISEIADPVVAEEVRSFGASAAFEDIVDYLVAFKVDGGQPPARMATI